MNYSSQQISLKINEIYLNASKNTIFGLIDIKKHVLNNMAEEYGIVKKEVMTMDIAYGYIAKKILLVEAKVKRCVNRVFSSYVFIGEYRLHYALDAYYNSTSKVPTEPISPSPPADIPPYQSSTIATQQLSDTPFGQVIATSIASHTVVDCVISYLHDTGKLAAIDRHARIRHAVDLRVEHGGDGYWSTSRIDGRSIAMACLNAGKMALAYKVVTVR